MRFATALAVSAAVHAALIGGAAAWFAMRPDGETTRAAMDVSAVELSLAPPQAEQNIPDPPPQHEWNGQDARCPGKEAPDSPATGRMPVPLMTTGRMPVPLMPPDPAAPPPTTERNTPEPPREYSLPAPQKTAAKEKAEEAPQPAREAAAPAPPAARIDAPARPRHAIKPDYPAECRRKRQQGKVAVEMEIGEDGRAFNVTVAKSSGYLELDAAAVKAVREARFAPARSGGRPVASKAGITLEFKLDH